ncbi:T9SS type A sorting domain-containing protein [Flavobacterium nackdongense]|uniref:T9SS type A sorting domain-containing protein n=1 Tax=Flavobacterium nackdongense TaxID=2547394 RepID=A0A4P6Y992_9FLAO|nr:T9SS type A sorting domain-containing protein [Flavobacterium nackdongense]QBN19571.1 T9SS type A sorting domain-containing protein [Flavobacterium nackdongense]
MKKHLLFWLLFASISLTGWAQSVTITSVISTPIAIGTVLKVDYKYTVAADSYIFCGINLQNDWTYISYVAGQGLDLAVAGTDVTGSFNITIPSGTTPTANLTPPQNYKIAIELKSLPTYAWIAGDYPATQLNFTASPLGISKKSLVEALSVYPNPAPDILKIANANNLSNASFRIIDILGKTVVQTKTLSNSGIDVSGLNSGFYVLSISSEEGARQFKFQKK